MKRRIALCLSVTVGILVTWSCLAAAAPLRLATEHAGGFFWIMGKELCRIWDGAGTPAGVVETTGEHQNLELLVSGKADLALVSGFALSDYLAENPGAPVVTVATCWTSAVHVLLNKKFIETGTMRDLDGRHLYLGPETSPAGIAARRILEALGITPNRYVRDIPPSQLLDVMTDFVTRELDGAIVIGPVPDPMVRDIVSDTGGTMRLIPASAADVAALAAAGLPVFLATIPIDSYAYQPDDLTVIAEGTYLVSRPDLPGETANKLRDNIFANAGRLAAYFPRGGTLSAKDAAAHPVAPMHPALR